MSRSTDTLYLQPQRRYVFYLVARQPGERYLRLVEATDGAAPDTPLLRAELGQLLKRSPGTWRRGPRGVRALLLAKAGTVAAGRPLDLRVLLQATGAKGVTYRMVRWPERTMSWTELVVRRAGLRVAHRRIPWLSVTERDAYFQRHTKPYQRRLEPWEVVTLHLSRVSTAVRGWGYKEELGFRYYPMTAPGRYAIQARLHRVVAGVPVVETAPVWVTVTPPRPGSR